MKNRPLAAAHIIGYALFALLGTAFIRGDQSGFPMPTGVNNVLFYLQRTINKNTIVYQLNLNEKNEVVEEEPIKIFWINYSGKGDTEPLSFIQRKYAYGVTCSLVDKEKKTFTFSFVSYKKQTLYLIKTGADKKYHAFSYFNGKLLRITRIYVHIEGGSFWTPKVKYVEVSGRDPVKNEDRTEKIVISN